jgi:uncharacterized membrane protein
MNHIPFESPLRKYRFRALTLACLALAATSLAGVFLQHGLGGLGRVAAVVGSAQLLGKWVIFAGASANNPYHFGPWELAFIVLNTDLLLALSLNTFLPELERLPCVGPLLVKSRQATGASFAQYPRLESMAWWGITLWVFLPLPASGAVTGSFASRLLSLSRISAVFAIAIGATGTCVVFGAMAQFLGEKSELLLHNWPVTLVSTLLFFPLLWWGWRKLVQILREEK